MRIIDALLSSLEGDAAVEDVRLSPFWTAVVSRGCGLAANFTAPGHHHDGAPVKDAGTLAGKQALELARLAGSSSVLESSIGMAAVNSLLQVNTERCEILNAGDLIEEKGKGKRVAVVGHFPFVEKLRRSARELWVIEMLPRRGHHAANEATEIIPRAEVVAITGSAFVNGTIEGLLALRSPGAFVVVLGPTTPLSSVLFDYGVDVVSGTRVVDRDTVLRYVSQGATFRQIRGVSLLTMRK
ncbi:MAG: DUF364 domain-containing protein [Dehalococcoidia bacterium]|nr:DUF364 domain-containing protein [Dehalococcoidia bacterium]